MLTSADTGSLPPAPALHSPEQPGAHYVTPTSLKSALNQEVRTDRISVAWQLQMTPSPAKATSNNHNNNERSWHPGTVSSSSEWPASRVNNDPRIFHFALLFLERFNEALHGMLQAPRALLPDSFPNSSNNSHSEIASGAPTGLTCPMPHASTTPGRRSAFG